MNDANAVQRKKRASVGTALLITALALPGALYGLLSLADMMYKPKFFKVPRGWYDFADIIVVGGVLSVLTTPVALVSIWLNRKRLIASSGLIAKMTTALAVLGWFGFVIRFANPFYKS